MAARELSKKIVNRLQAICKLLIADPKHYDQNAFYDPDTGAGCIVFYNHRVKHQRKSAKKYAELINDSYSTGGFLREACDDLGFDSLGRNTADRHWFYLLGNPHWWPEKFKRMHDEAKGPKGRARAAVRRIEHYIATNGAE